MLLTLKEKHSVTLLRKPRTAFTSQQHEHAADQSYVPAHTPQLATADRPQCASARPWESWFKGGIKPPLSFNHSPTTRYGETGVTVPSSWGAPWGQDGRNTGRITPHPYHTLTILTAASLPASEKRKADFATANHKAVRGPSTWGGVLYGVFVSKPDPEGSGGGLWLCF